MAGSAPTILCDTVRCARLIWINDFTILMELALQLKSNYFLTTKESTMKKLLIGSTLAAAVLASTQLLADPGHGNHERHGQNTPCTGTHCPAETSAHQGQHGMGHGSMRGKMQAMHSEHQGMGHRGKPGAQRGNAGEGCPMHAERKPT